MNAVSSYRRCTKNCIAHFMTNVVHTRGKRDKIHFLYTVRFLEIDFAAGGTNFLCFCTGFCVPKQPFASWQALGFLSGLGLSLSLPSLLSRPYTPLYIPYEEYNLPLAATFDKGLSLSHVSEQPFSQVW